MKVKLLSRVQLFMTPWTGAYQAPPSMGFPRQEYWSGLPLPSPSGIPDGSVVKNLPANTGEPDAFTGLGRSPGEGNGNPLQYSCLENPMDRGVWWPIVQRVAQCQT